VTGDSRRVPSGRSPRLALLFGTVMMGPAVPAGVACVAAFAAQRMWRWAERHSHRYRPKMA
jgi:hypothetical protein